MHLQQYGTFSKMREGTKENVLLLFLEKVIEGKLKFRIQNLGFWASFYIFFLVSIFLLHIIR